MTQIPRDTLLSSNCHTKYSTKRLTYVSQKSSRALYKLHTSGRQPWQLISRQQFLGQRLSMIVYAAITMEVNARNLKYD